MDGQQTLARTAWGENRSGGSRAMQVTINTVMNRVNAHTWYGDNVIDVCLKPEQYSCWNKNDPNYSKLINPQLNDPQFRIAINLADMALDGILPDITHGATHYIAASIKKEPEWAQGKTPCAVVAGNICFKDV